jgi:radical SAM superfamily enzyme YgiQ (UPF0313 family)
VDAPAERLSETAIASRLAPGALLFCLSSPLSAGADVPFLSRMKERAGVRTVLFGAYPTFEPARALRENGADFILRGEPEVAAAQLARRLASGEPPASISIPGVGYGFPGNPAIPADSTEPPDLDALPFPDRTLIPGSRNYFNPVVRHPRFTTAFTSRGCFGKCTFCSAARFSGGSVRYRSADSVLEELRVVRSQGYREVFFRDELFTGHRGRLAAICEGMRRAGEPLSWICSTRVDLLDGNAAKMMRAAGCHLVRMGVESGSQAVLDRVRKGITVEETRAAFDACRQAGLSTHAHTMLGLPGETEEDFLLTLRLIREIRPTYLTMSICTPFPGTALHGESTGIGGATDYLSGHDGLGLHSVAVTAGISRIPAGDLPNLLKRTYRDFYWNWGTVRRHLLSLDSPGMALRKARAGLALLPMVRVEP